MQEENNLKINNAIEFLTSKGYVVRKEDKNPLGRFSLSVRGKVIKFFTRREAERYKSQNNIKNNVKVVE